MTDGWTDGRTDALEALCDYALYKSTFTFTLNYIKLIYITFYSKCNVKYYALQRKFSEVSVGQFRDGFSTQL